MLFFVHGGGWRAGDKSADGRTKFIDLCLRQGMGVALINASGRDVRARQEPSDKELT